MSTGHMPTLNEIAADIAGTSALDRERQTTARCWEGMVGVGWYLSQEYAPGETGKDARATLDGYGVELGSYAFQWVAHMLGVPVERVLELRETDASTPSGEGR